ncbi:MAG: Fe-S cluster assembly protein SufD [Motiliproteus sp.]
MAATMLLSETAVEKSPPVSNWPWLAEFRRKAQLDFRSQGLPNTRLEQWKYTSIKALADTEFQVDTDAMDVQSSLLQRDKAEYLKAEQSAAEDDRLVFLAGRFQAGLSRISPLPPGAKLLSLRQALEQEHPLVRAHLGRIAKHQGHPFAALNSLWLDDGLFLYLPADCQLRRTVHCLFYSPSGPSSFTSYPRLLILLESGAQAQLVEEYLGSIQPGDDNGAAQFTDSLTEVSLADGASLTHCKLLRESAQGHHIAGLHVEQAENSRFQSFSLTLGGGICRNDVQVRLTAGGAETRLDGLYLLGGRQHLDNHLRIDHLQPGCRSEVFYKGILNDRSRGVFNGIAVVHPGAQQSDARQVNKNLMLSIGAEIDTKPELQIEADDVQCSHGAAVGQLDDDALFYLCSRGLERNQARALLTFAFAREALGRIPSGPLSERLEAMTFDALASQMGGALSMGRESLMEGAL